MPLQLSLITLSNFFLRSYKLGLEFDTVIAMLARPILPSFFASSQMDQQINQWDFIIKVRHGDTLRRLGAHVHGKLMDYNISKLRDKIISLFNFSADADLILTYTDVDGDIVTLDNDDELRDAVIGQRLDPLRITVQLKSISDTSVDSLQSKTSSVATEPVGYIEVLTSVPDVLMNVVGNLINVFDKILPNSPASEVLKYEPLKNVMKNIHKDLKKATSSSPAPSNQTEPVSELASTMPFVVPAANPIYLNIAYEPKQPEMTNAMNDSTTKQDVRKASSFLPALSNYDEHLFEGRNSYINRTEPISGSTPTKPSVVPAANPMNLNVPFEPKMTNTTIHSTTKQDNSTQTVDAAGSFYRLEDFQESIWAPNNYPGNHEGKEAGGYNNYWGDFVSKEAALPLPELAHSVTKECLGYSPTNSLYTHAEGSNKNTSSEARIYSNLPTYPVLSPALHPYFQGVHLNEEHTIHRGFQCDGCGTDSIIGTRFEPNRKKDHDLCDVCYTKMGNEADYTRINCATPPRLFQFQSQSSPHCSNAVSLQRTKLESLFIQDITVLDGTVMPPSTPFTKIWRLRNSGTVCWPFGTQLVWVGGDQFGQRTSVALQIPVHGLPVDDELDVAIDFTTPSKPGRYVSYWRMQAHDLQKFGQRVRVLIQVEEDFHSKTALNLNLPPEKNPQDTESTLGININAEPLDDSFIKINSAEVANNISAQPVPEPSNISVKKVPVQTAEQQSAQSAPAFFKLVDIADNKELSKAASLGSDTVKNNEETVKFAWVDPTLVADALANVDEYEYAAKSFMVQFPGLEYDQARKAVEEFCPFVEWDRLLFALERMGFHDRRLNMEMLMKNESSLKRTVLDLSRGKED